MYEVVAGSEQWHAIAQYQNLCPDRSPPQDPHLDRRCHRSSLWQKHFHTPCCHSQPWWTPSLNGRTGIHAGNLRATLPAPLNLRKRETRCSFMRFQVPHLVKLLQGTSLLFFLQTKCQNATQVNNNNNNNKFQKTGTCKDTVAKATHIVFLRDCILQDKHCDATTGGWQSSVHCYLRGHGTSSAIVHAQGAARVEAIPAEPQGEGAQHNQWKIVDFKLFRILEATLARSQDNSAHQARYATRQVDDASKWMLCVGPEKNWTGQLPCWFVIKHDKA